MEPTNDKLKVEDEGAGFDPSTQCRRVESGHFGPFSSRERLEYLGGTLRIQSAPGVGTTVTVMARFQPTSSDERECLLRAISKAD
jgi:signal transduction histidine kinase